MEPWIEEIRRNLQRNPTPELRKLREEIEYLKVVDGIFNHQVKIIRTGGKS